MNVCAMYNEDQVQGYMHLREGGGFRGAFIPPPLPL